MTDLPEWALEEAKQVVRHIAVLLVQVRKEGWAAGREAAAMKMQAQGETDYAKQIRALAAPGEKKP